MKSISWSRALFSLVFALGLIAGCGTDSVPSCADVSWLGRLNHAQLTGVPSFSAAQIAPGDPLTIAVPVDVNTRGVRAWIRSVDEAPPGSASLAETDGGEIVEVSVEDTNLPAGVYVAGIIGLDGEIAPQTVSYAVDDLSMRYTLTVSSGTEAPGLSCVTDMLAPTFTVAVENASGSGR